MWKAVRLAWTVTHVGHTSKRLNITRTGTISNVEVDAVGPKAISTAETPNQGLVPLHVLAASVGLSLS